MGMNACASAKALAAEAEMAETLRSIEQRHAQDARFLEALGRAQGEWLRYARDSPASARRNYAFGSMLTPKPAAARARYRDALLGMRDGARA